MIIARIFIAIILLSIIGACKFAQTTPLNSEPYSMEEADQFEIYPNPDYPAQLLSQGGWTPEQISGETPWTQKEITILEACNKADPELIIGQKINAIFERDMRGEHQPPLTQDQIDILNYLWSTAY